MKSLVSARWIPLALLCSMMACSDEGEDDATGSTSSASSTSGSGSSSSDSVTSSTSSSSTSSGGATGGGGSGGEGGMGGQGFGPCHGYVDDFDTFDPLSTTDYWLADGALPEPLPDPAVVLTPIGGSYAGIFSEIDAVASNCFTSVAVEDPGEGSVFLEIVEGTGLGPKVILEYQAGVVAAVDIQDPMGMGETVGTLVVADLRGLRIQVLDGELRFEANDGGTWADVGTLTPQPEWMAAPVNLSTGMSDPGASTSVLDDFNLDPPM